MNEREAKKAAIGMVLNELMDLQGHRSDKIEEMFITAIEEVERTYEYAL